MVLKNERKNLTDDQNRPVLFARTCHMRLRYSLIFEKCGDVTFYGIEIDSLSDDGAICEHVVLPELCSDRSLAVCILKAMCRGAVTPCGAAGVADDMLAESVFEADLKKIETAGKNT